MSPRCPKVACVRPIKSFCLHGQLEKVDVPVPLPAASANLAEGDSSQQRVEPRRLDGSWILRLFCRRKVRASRAAGRDQRGPLNAEQRRISSCLACASSALKSNVVVPTRAKAAKWPQLATPHREETSVLAVLLAVAAHGQLDGADLVRLLALLDEGKVPRDCVPWVLQRS